MTRMMTSGLAAGALAFALAGCDQPLDMDMRGLGGGFSTAGAAQSATAPRPTPDDRGVISYPSYQVAVAKRGDTLADVARRVDLPASDLARFNGIEPDVPLREGEVIALPRRVTEPSPATGAIGTGPILPAPVDVSSLAGAAIDNAAPTTPVPGAPKKQTGAEPIRHKVVRGETAYTIARLYNVPVRSLAEWNGLGADFAVREGQYLLIPVARQAPPVREAAVTRPGDGSPTPTPPSATQPLPPDDTAQQVAVPKPTEPVADVGTPTRAPSNARMARPVDGKIIRDYAKGRNEGIDIQGDAGAPVKAAEGGTVAALTESADGVPIIVLRHDNNLMTVYANVADVKVSKGDRVSRGQSIAELRGGDASYLHFEVRDGFDSVDPNEYLN